MTINDIKFQHFLKTAKFQHAGEKLADLETPVPVIDLGIMWRNLQRWQQRCDTLGLRNRPHIKTHKIPAIAKLQVALGATGITVQKLSEAEVMAQHGFDDMLLTFNVVGNSKLDRLMRLLDQTNISVVADNTAVITGLSEASQHRPKPVVVLVECDTGAARNGVQTPRAASELAKQISTSRGLRFGGVMTYPKAGMRLEAQAYLAEAKQLIQSEGLNVPLVTSGGTPDMWSDAGLAGIDEYRAGTYIYNDRSLVERGVCTFDDCALNVLATVVSTPTPQRAMLDAGSKSLTSDLLGLKGYGVVRETGFSPVYDVSEEHGFLDMTSVEMPLQVGDRVRIIPNHVCPVSNLFDKVAFTLEGKLLGTLNVEARGAVT